MMSSPSSGQVTTTPWHAHLTIDLLARVLQTSIFHPFIAWLVPLCQRAVATPYTHPAMQLSMAWASVVCVFWVLAAINRRVAYGTPRRVDFADDEVIVVTGGASGLGALMAEVYGLRGASVAVLDVHDPSAAAKGGGQDEDGDHELEERGVQFYQCDVSDRKQLDQVARRIEEDVFIPCSCSCNTFIVPPACFSPSLCTRVFRKQNQ